MKQFLLTIVGILMFGIANAQRVELSIDIDYSEAVICGMDEETFAEYEKDWRTDKPEINSIIVKKMLKSMADNFLIKKNAPNIVKIKMYNITENGGMNCSVEVIDSAGVTKVKVDEVKCNRGGVFGTKLNLMKDGAEKIGSMIGRKIKKALLQLTSN